MSEQLMLAFHPHPHERARQQFYHDSLGSPLVASFN
jgi:hypothetical protein